MTAAQIQEVAKHYFVADRLNTVRIVPIGSGDEATSEMAQNVESEVIRKTLSNGITLLLKRHAVTPLVSMQLTRLLAF
ncbi:MAG: hypothetical protein R3C11_00605 [Planctomycetaceae bacterium]